MKKVKGERTLWLSVLFSAPGPLILAIGMIWGSSSTQLADLARRSMELAAIIVSLIIFKITNGKKEITEEKKTSLERWANIFVGIAMCLSGIIITLIAIFLSDKEKGNVMTSLVIAILGVVMNTFFCVRYFYLNKNTPNAILSSQARLYSAKAFVDLSVMITLIVIMVYPNTTISDNVDLIGSIIVSVYLAVFGVINIIKTRKPRSVEE